MIYVMSDLHGCYNKYLKMLERINLAPDDTLYILGDIVDRGSDGIRIIRDLSERKNIITLRGNHDHEAMVLLKNFAMHNVGDKSDGLFEIFGLWLLSGGTTTYQSFLELNEADKYLVLSFLGTLPLFEETEVGGQKYFLSHTVPEKEKMLNMDTCHISDFIMGEPEYEKKYFEDTIIVTGHSITGFIDCDSLGKIWNGNNHIAVDCGAVFGNPLGCICLDTMEEFYVQE